MKILVNEKISQHKYKTPEGYLICVDSVLARTGNQTYRKNELFVDSEDDSEIEVGRSPEEVFAPETLASFENKPITIEHPDEDVNIENYKDYSVGFVRDVKQGKFDGQDVILGTLVITDKDAIEGIENGEHVELSCGYDCDIEDGADGYQQRHIRGNHVALCEAGRAGIAKIVDSVEVNDERTSMTKEITKAISGLKSTLFRTDFVFESDAHGMTLTATDSYGIDPAEKSQAMRYVELDVKAIESRLSKITGYTVTIAKYSLYKERYSDPNAGLNCERIWLYGKKIRDSVKDAKKYAVEFTYDGDSVSNYLGQVWVYANSDKEALKKAEQWAKNKYDDAWNFKIVPKAYSNSEVIDCVEDADEPRLDRAQRRMLQNYLSMISAFTSRDTDIKDVLRPLSGKGFKYTIDKIEGWIWKKGEMAYKNYYISLDGYKDKFMVTLYADPNKDWKVNEVNAYFTDSVKDASQFTTRDLDKLYQARIRSGAVTSKPESISKKVGKLTVGITFEINYKEHNNVSVPDELIFTVWDSSRWNNGNDDKTFTYRSYKEMTSKYREVVDYANSHLSSLTDSVKDDRKLRYDVETVLSNNLKKMFYRIPEIKNYGDSHITFYMDEYDAKNVSASTIKKWFKTEGLDISKIDVKRSKHLTNWSGKTEGYDFDVYLTDSVKDEETADEEQTTMLEKDLELFEDADVNDAVLNWKKTYLGEETDEIRLPQGSGSIIASYDDIRNKTKIRFLGGSRGSSRDDVIVKGKPKTLEQLLKYVKDSVNDTKWEVGKRVRYEGQWWYIVNFSRGDWILENEKDGSQTRVRDSINDVDPRSGESKDDFIARFMKATKNEYPDEKQRLAVAYSYWEKKGRDSMVKDINPDYANCLRELDKDVNQLYKLYQHGDKAPSTILHNMGYKEVGLGRFVMKSGLNQMVIDFDDSDYIKYYVVDESGKIPRGYTITKFKFYDSKAKDSIYSLTVQGQKSKKLVRAKDAREAIDKYTKMFPKDKIKSVKKTDKFNNIIDTIRR